MPIVSRTLAAAGMIALPVIATAQEVAPVTPAPDPDELKPGLAVCYMYELVRHIDEMVEHEGQKDCTPGDPLTTLNSGVGLKNVLTSTRRDGVMARITGLIHLDQPGSWAFTFQSNDGVRLEIGEQMVVQDPDVHADQWSDIGTLEVAEPGWYPLTIRYFERKNTSTLRFHWQPPGVEGSMPLVPSDALAHLEPAA